MAFLKSGTNVPDAIRSVFPGPKKDLQLAAAIGISSRQARKILSGDYPSSWTKFLNLINKRPAILELIFKDDWAAHLALTREINETRARLLQMEKRLANTAKGTGSDSG